MRVKYTELSCLHKIHLKMVASFGEGNHQVVGVESCDLFGGFNVSLHPALPYS